MSESEIIKKEHHALMKFCNGDRQMILKIIQDHGHKMRQYFDEKGADQVTCEELCSLLESATNQESSS